MVGLSSDVGSSAEAADQGSALVADAIRGLRKRISDLSAACNRTDDEPPLLLAVSKLKPAEAIRAAYDAGQRHFGENYVQEVVEKSSALPSDIRWHMIGRLQSNKCSQLLSVPNLSCIETTDSNKLADKLESVCKSLGRHVDVLVQVNTSGEDTKNGLGIVDAKPLFEHIVKNCPHLFAKGLMTVAHPDLTKAARCFDDLCALKDSIQSDVELMALRAKQLETLNTDNENLGRFVLSMGMSDDLEVAVQRGSTEIRIGTAIFGARSKSGATK